ncbi:Uncharacterized protein dnm_080940 [Desulfonema magnum]|uniref:Uncharacterized protein n=1 Tax=Desulfonema magnum TaxID=45655 RepID=A0A975BVR7_9BACT|nr:Uncharacterized protein dnm_080940 [Desulfonema magnum]
MISSVMNTRGRASGMRSQAEPGNERKGKAEPIRIFSVNNEQ